MVLSRKGLSATFLAVAGSVFYGVLLTTAPSEAQNTLNCSDFSSEAAAQAKLRRDPSDPNGLDGPPGSTFEGIEGVACESPPGPKDLTPVLPSGNSGGAEQSVVPENSVGQSQSNQQGQSIPESSTAQGSSATAGGASAQSSREKQKQDVVKSTVPKRRLAPTAGPPAYVLVTSSILVGTSLLGLGLVIRRGRRS